MIRSRICFFLLLAGTGCNSAETARPPRVPRRPRAQQHRPPRRRTRVYRSRSRRARRLRQRPRRRPRPNFRKLHPSSKCRPTPAWCSRREAREFRFTSARASRTTPRRSPGSSRLRKPIYSTTADRRSHTNFAGPTWQATDGSSALGSMRAKADAPDPQAVPWLLLTAVGKGPGLFARVMHVQRLDTSGGKAPASGCDAAKAKAKAETRVPYEATYYFYALTPGSK